MKKLLPVVLILIVLGVFYWKKMETPPPAPVAVPTLAPTPTIPVLTVQKKKPAQTGKKIQSIRPATSDKGRIVKFRVKDRLAVAFGDVILGEAEDPQLEEGYYEMPPLQMWEEREIPYFLSEQLAHPDRVEAALKHIEKNSSIRFIPYNGQTDAIAFVAGANHCLSYLGKLGGVQPIRLDSKCRWSDIVHEVMHALGFIHEQSRYDRDNHVEILWDNIEKGYDNQFEKTSEELGKMNERFAFDLDSIMLYSSGLFAKSPGLVTMRARSGALIPPKEKGLSKGDVERLNYFYPQ